MSHPADPAPAAVDPDAMPPRTTPTWEMELLLSGATVFALVPLIGVLDQRFYLAFPDMDAAQGHELVVARTQNPERQRAGKPERHYRIPFWKQAPEPRS